MSAIAWIGRSLERFQKIIFFFVRAHQLKTPVVWGYKVCARPVDKELIKEIKPIH